MICLVYFYVHCKAQEIFDQFVKEFKEVHQDHFEALFWITRTEEDFEGFQGDLMNESDLKADFESFEEFRWKGTRLLFIHFQKLL